MGRNGENVSFPFKNQKEEMWMSTDDLMEEITKGIENAVSPANLTTQAINMAINSKSIQTAIQKILIDPVRKAAIPTIESTDGYRSIYAIMHAATITFGDKFLNEVLGLDADKKYMEEYMAALSSKRPTDIIWWLSDTEKGKPQTDIIYHKGCVVYFQIESYHDKYDYVKSITVSFFGPKAKRMKEEFEKTKEGCLDYLDNGIREKYKRMIKVIRFDNNSPRPRHSTSSVPTTVIVDHVQDELEQIIQTVNKSDEVTSKYEINKSVGVLLYGPHGTGKSTLVRYLAMELGRTIILTTADTLSTAVDYVKDQHQGSGNKNHYIILIEDIDFKFVDRRASKDNEANSEMAKQTDMLFQLLDGAMSDSNIMVCATTNYIDKLDPALIRDGRFDFRIEVNGLDYETAAKVCERFDVTPEEIKLKEWDFPVAPASLQTYILKFKTKLNK